MSIVAARGQYLSSITLTIIPIKGEKYIVRVSIHLIRGQVLTQFAGTKLLGGVWVGS